MVVANRADPKALVSVWLSAFSFLVAGAAVSLASTGVVKFSAEDAVLDLAALVRLGLALGLVAALAVLAADLLSTGVTLDSVILFLGQSGEGSNGFLARGHEPVCHGLNGGCHRGSSLSPGIHGGYFCG